MLLCVLGVMLIRLLLIGVKFLLYDVYRLCVLIGDYMMLSCGFYVVVVCCVCRLFSVLVELMLKCFVCRLLSSFYVCLRLM